MLKNLKKQDLIGGIYLVFLILMFVLSTWLKPISLPLSYLLIISYSIIAIAIILCGYKIYKGMMHVKPMTYVLMITIILLLAIQVGNSYTRYLLIKPEYEALAPEIELCLEDPDACNIANGIDGQLLKSTLEYHSNRVFIFVHISLFVILVFPLFQYDPSKHKNRKAYDV